MTALIVLQSLMLLFVIIGWMTTVSIFGALNRLLTQMKEWQDKTVVMPPWPDRENR